MQIKIIVKNFFGNFWNKYNVNALKTNILKICTNKNHFMHRNNNKQANILIESALDFMLSVKIMHVRSNETDNITVGTKFFFYEINSLVGCLIGCTNQHSYF